MPGTSICVVRILSGITSESFVRCMQSVAHAASPTNSINSVLQWSVTVHLSSCGVCLVGSDVSVPHFVAAFSSVFVGIFWVVFPGFFSRFFSTWDSKGAKV